MFQSGFAALHDQAKPAFGGGVVLFARGLLLAFIVVAGGLAESPPAAADEAPVAFIRALGTQALSVIRSDTLPVEKAAYFRQMIHQDFDLTGMCRFVLGPDWRIASPAERRQFRSLFTDRLVRIYGRQLVKSGDGDFVVTGSKTDPSGVIVTSQIIRAQAAPIAVEWRLGIKHGFYKIEDVAIDQVSMVLAQRTAIDDLIARGWSGRDASRDDAPRGMRRFTSDVFLPPELIPDADSAAKPVDVLTFSSNFSKAPLQRTSDYQVTVDSPFTREPIIVAGSRHNFLT
jgi:phospholipid transport system substrate-binding protein